MQYPLDYAKDSWYTVHIAYKKENNMAKYKNEFTSARVDSATAGKLKRIAYMKGLTVSELLKDMTETEYECIKLMTVDDIENGS
jgi:hypothetical protein